jgi:hypothetical protein
VAGLPPENLDSWIKEYNEARPSGTLVFRENSVADLPGRNPDDEEKMIAA